LNQPNAWGYREDGRKCLDGEDSKYGKPFENRTVKVEVNRSEGWLNFYVEGKD